MNIKNRIRKISDAMRANGAEVENAHVVTLEQWKRYADGEDITAEIPAHRRAAFNEWLRVVNERRQQAERTYRLHTEEI